MSWEVQEELYLKSLLRNTTGKEDPVPVSLSYAKTELFDIDKTVNAVPLDDLQSTSHQQLHPNNVEDAEEDDEDEEEMDSEDCQGNQEEDGINKDLMALMRQMQGEDSYEEDFGDEI
ncbi:uncharacterized protein LOC119745617 isoform X2 [Patiria miniata]|uniref:Uncharacterized protein n=1 Tax=Patiria miniata TaxID=46514 RepID=A0A914BPG8_PATMI|nr:uncharacterized protein LOC119745617 isoform X2 [Patiria miniata]